MTDDIDVRKIRGLTGAGVPADGPADAASGRTLQLESGSALRVIAGGVIGRGSASRLIEGLTWLTMEGRARRTKAEWRISYTTRAATVAALALSAGRWLWWGLASLVQ